MSTNYEMWLNYDNDNMKYLFPMLPESLKYTYKGLATSVEIDKFGEVFHKGKRGAGVITFSGIFPPTWSTLYCQCTKAQFKAPKTWISYIKSLMNKAEPAHFAVTEEGGDVGAAHYTLEMKEYRKVSVTKYTKPAKPNKPPKKDPPKKRPSNKKKPKTYKVKSGDCLWNIAKKFYGNGALYTKIYNANKSKIKNPNLIYPGQVLTIP